MIKRIDWFYSANNDYDAPDVKYFDLYTDFVIFKRVPALEKNTVLVSDMTVYDLCVKINEVS